MIIQKVGERLFIFQFVDELQKDWVMQKQPWSFNKSLLLLKEIKREAKPEDIDIDWCPFMIQIHGLQLGMMIEKIGVILGGIH